MLLFEFAPRECFQLLTAQDGSAPALSAAQLQSVINALTHIFRSAQAAKAVALHPSPSLSPGAQAVLSGAWDALTSDGVLVRRAQKNRAGPAATGAQTTLQVGKLLSMDWRLGLGVASSACADLAAPYVTLQLKIADAFGTVSVKTMELSVAQFTEFSKDVHAMAARLELV